MKLSQQVSLALLATLTTTSAHKLPKLPSLNLASLNSIFHYSTPKTKHHHNLHTTEDELEKYPNITLDYGIHLPTSVNTDAGFVLYSNVRYAQNPVGDLRWAAPVAPEKIDGGLPVFNGSEGHSCYQAIPHWVIDALQKQPGNKDWDWEKAYRTSTDGDDCLFLDVATPLEVVENETYPVLVWFYGGGYVYGAKDWDVYNPAGFYRRALEAGDNKFIYVAINYRMGAYGFLSGPEFIEEGGVSNLGLHDQRFALQWIKDNIEKFGGDANQVTVMGESAGAGSIAHQLVWKNSDSTDDAVDAAPFQKAILQSPAWVPVPGSDGGKALQDDTYLWFLEILDVGNLEDARNKTEDEIKDANRKLVAQAPKGTFITGPVVDGAIIKEHPLVSFLQGKQDRSVQIFTGAVAGEGIPFVDLRILGQDFDLSYPELERYIRNALPLISDKALAAIFDAYPVGQYISWDYQGVLPQSKRIADIVGQALVQCNARGFSTASLGQTYNYLFKKVDDLTPLNWPLLHGGDVAYTFYDNPETVKPGFNIHVAETWQQYLLGFVLESDPNHLNPVVPIPKYGQESLVVQFDQTGANVVVDPRRGPLCDAFWPETWATYGTFPKSGWDGISPGKPGQGPSPGPLPGLPAGPLREAKHKTGKALKYDASGSKKPGAKDLTKEIAQDILLSWEQDELR